MNNPYDYEGVDDGSEDLYSDSMAYGGCDFPSHSQPPQQQQPAAAPAGAPGQSTAAGAPTSGSPDPLQGLAQAVQFIAAPEATLVSQVLPSDPAQSKFPLGWAVVGSCIAAMIWANSFDGDHQR